MVTSEVIARNFFVIPFKNIYAKNGVKISLETIKLSEDTYTLRISSLFFMIKSVILGNKIASSVLNTTVEKNMLQRIKDLYENIGKVINDKI